LLIHSAILAYAADSTDKKVVYKFKIERNIDEPALYLVQKAMSQANEVRADYILLELNTYGGMVYIADSIRTRLLNAKQTILVYISNNAASAGALISIACDSIYMNKAATIGAATVVDQSGKKMPDKYQSYMRAKMRATAEATGRDPDIAEAMVDERFYIPGIIDSGKILTFTTSEAIKHGYCEGEVSSIEEVLALAQITHYEIIAYAPTAIDRMIGFLLNPIFHSLLLMIIFGGLYFELQTPGVGFPLGAAIVAAILFFAPLYLEGLAAHWEIALFIVGLILVGVEIFVIPGFGVAGISGIMIMLTSLTLSLLNNNDFDFTPVQGIDIEHALYKIFISMFLTIILSITFGASLLKSPLFKKIALETTQDSREGYIIDTRTITGLVNKKAIAATPLRPSGKIEINNDWHDAITEGEYIDKGEKVLVIRISGSNLVVTKEFKIPIA